MSNITKEEFDKNVGNEKNMKKQYLELATRKYDFDYEKSLFSVYYDSTTNQITKYNFELKFKEGFYDDENTIDPKIIINSIKTNVDKIEKLTNTNFSISTVEESMQRDDSFYSFEFEPFLNYELTIKEIDEHEAHIIISGDTITNDHSQETKGEHFIADVIVKVSLIQNDKKTVKNDKQKSTFNLEKIINILIGVGFIIFGLYFMFNVIIGNTVFDYKSIILIVCGISIGIIMVIQNLKNSK